MQRSVFNSSAGAQNRCQFRCLRSMKKLLNVSNVKVMIKQFTCVLYRLINTGTAWPEKN